MPSPNTVMLDSLNAGDVAAFLKREAPDALQPFFEQFGGWRFVSAECPDDGMTVATEDGNICLVCGIAIVRHYIANFSFAVDVEAVDEDEAEEKAEREVKRIMGYDAWETLNPQSEGIEEA